MFEKYENKKILKRKKNNLYFKIEICFKNRIKKMYLQKTKKNKNIHFYF